MPEKEFWVEEFETKANHIFMKLKDTKAYLAGDVQVVASSSQHLATPQFTAPQAQKFDMTPWTDLAAHGPAAPGRGKKAEKGKAKGKGDGAAQQATKAPENIVANRCIGFNNGRCKGGEHKDKHRVCPIRPGLLHTCSKCGGKHAWPDCTQVSPSEKSAIGRNPKDKGNWDDNKQPKKKGKGEGKKKWEW
jgi:hypothetical protein